MPIELKGSTFYALNEVAELAEVTRQTIWRWKRDGKVPSGRRYRGRELLFTRRELKKICDYAHRLEPDASTSNVEADQD